MKKRYILMFGIASLFSFSAIAQQTVTGTVQDKNGVPLKGVTVSSVGTNENRVTTDEAGVFAIKAKDGDYLEVRLADGKVKREWVSGENMRISLSDQDLSVYSPMNNLTDASQSQAISTISGEILDRNSTHNVANSLGGLFSGLLMTQKTGWTDNPGLSIRGGGSLKGQSPLIIVDGIPRELQYLNMEEIESVSILKDGAATALWGLRGANGVIVVKTKRGQYNSKDIDIRYSFGMGLPINEPKFVDGYTYAAMKNEALKYDGLPLQYSPDQLEAFRTGSNPDLYPNTDWMGEALRNHTTNHQLNLAFRGGGSSLRYYALVNYKNDQGILNNNITNFSDRYDAQMKKYDLNARINLDIDITKSTKVTLSMFGLLKEENRPRTSVENIFSNLYNTPSAAFPIHTSSGNWGGSTLFPKNPIAEIADVGFFKTNRRTLQSNLRLSQDFSMLTKGLSIELAIAYDNDAVFQETGTKNYSYEVNNIILNPETGNYDIETEQKGDNSALSISNGGLNSQYMRTVLEGKVLYDRAFGRHSVMGSLQYWQQSYVPMGRNNSRYRQSYMFTAGYNYNNRYIADLVVNRMGTSVLSDGDKFRTYPAVSGAWIISNESFMKNLASVNLLKLRASWGRSGNDNIDYDLDKHFWVGTGGYQFQNPPVGSPGMNSGILPIKNLNIEMADKYDVGVDLQMFRNRLSMTADVFFDKRRNILISSEALFSDVIGTGIPQQNVGAVDSKGLELSMAWKDRIGNDFNYYVGGNLSTVKNKIIENGEGYQPFDYLYRKNSRLGQVYGLEALGYFNDWDEIEKSPQQMFSEVRPGDIKYKDQNGDNKIDEFDVVAIGHSTSTPKIFYGLNLGFEYKGFGIDMLFQGVSKVSRMLNTRSVYWPMRNGTNNLSQWYLKDNVRWTEETKDTATLPRLTTLNNANNFRNSTQWLANGSFFKLRNLNVYYNLPENWTKKMRMDKCQIYFRANNLFSIDHIDYSNSEDLSINYPDLLSLYVGLNINF